MARKNINPDMELKKESAKSEAIQTEHDAAKTQAIGVIPTGIKAAKKVTVGQG